MTRVLVYAGLLVFSIAATVMTVLPSASTAAAPTSATPCQTFPTDEQCDAASDDKGRFCHLWRSAGFLANLAVAVQLVTVVAYVFVVAGGKQKRDQGWKVLAGLLTAVAVLEYFIIGIVSYAYDNDEQFLIPGWSLDTSWILCILSASLSVASAIALSSTVT
ncbi:unnamed protein product [Parascedosporium putredinis]|uniref:Uncharacterized protein n=1 Tax=Parascedosporium putredinis TaxID=1442378 RepID=A0A9P1H3T6_9PEZI|nr:unnamed protein product [Parascedosporium putredinis]CAI7996007.1 unnamed protein product [Parascedosporium putredinis]